MADLDTRGGPPIVKQGLWFIDSFVGTDSRKNIRLPAPQVQLRLSGNIPPAGRCSLYFVYNVANSSDERRVLGLSGSPQRLQRRRHPGVNGQT